MAAIAVVGAGAMGAALGMHVARANPETVLLATEWDAVVVDAWRDGAVHPALGLAHPALPCHPYGEWEHRLGNAEIVVVAVSTEGLRPMLAEAASRARRDAVWVIATKAGSPGRWSRRARSRRRCSAATSGSCHWRARAWPQRSRSGHQPCWCAPAATGGLRSGPPRSFEVAP